jgi:hypothetical protein
MTGWFTVPKMIKVEHERYVIEINKGSSKISKSHSDVINKKIYPITNHLNVIAGATSSAINSSPNK